VAPARGLKEGQRPLRWYRSWGLPLNLTGLLVRNLGQPIRGPPVPIWSNGRVEWVIETLRRGVRLRRPLHQRRGTVVDIALYPPTTSPNVPPHPARGTGAAGLVRSAPRATPSIAEPLI
jgi:hypothetical protein